MSARDATKIIRVPGRLAVAPTNLATAFPHGGTELGAVRAVALRLRQRDFDVVAEEFDEVVETVHGAMRVVGLACLLRQFDDTVIAKVFPSTSTGSSSGSKVIDIPGTARAGRLASATAVKYVFTPDNQTDHQAIILYKADAALETDGAEIMCHMMQERVLPVVFKPIRDTSSPARVCKIGKLADLSL